MKFSIITINYNNREGLILTIKSIVRQTFKDFEFIVIDGGSTDGSVDVLKQHDKSITYWTSEHDDGIYNAMNKGIIHATGDYLNFMNSGDCFYNEEVLTSLADRNLSSDIIVGRDYHIDPKTQKGFATILPPRISMVTFFIQTLPHQSSFFKRELFSNALYDESFRIVADIKFYIQKLCIESCSIDIIDDIICRREPDGISKSDNERRITEHQTVLKQFLPDGVIKDYQTLARLDKTTLYKLLKIIESPKSNKLLTFCIKVINKIYG